MSHTAEAPPVRPWILGLVVFVAAVAVFAPALDGPWILDDHPLIAENDVTHEFANWRRWLSGHLWDTTFGGANLAPPAAHYWRPLVQASYALDWKWGGGRPLAFHATNLLLHGVASLLVWAALRRWLKSELISVIAALMFAIHPAKAENVAWISGRPDLLLGIGVGVCLLGVAARCDGRWFGSPVEFTGLAIAFASKESAVVLPALVALEWWCHARSVRKVGSFIKSVLPSACALLAYGGWRLLVTPIIEKRYPLDAWLHLRLIFETFGRYAALYLWPDDLSLERATIPTSVGQPFVASTPWVVVGIASCAFGAALVVLGWRRAPRAAAGTAIFSVALLPIANLTLMPNLVLATPRFLYLPSIGAALAWGGLAVATTRYRTLVVSLALLAGVCFGARAVVRSMDFRSEDQFWSYELAKNPRLTGRSYFIARELMAGRPRSGLALVAEAMAHPGPNEVRFGPDLNTLTAGLGALLTLVPDSRSEDLRAIARFARHVREQHQAELAIPWLGVRIAQSPPRNSPKPFHFMLVEMDVASRLGEDNRALELVEKVLADCAGCDEVVQQPFFAAARAGDLELAERVLARVSRETDSAGTLALKLREARILVSTNPSWRSEPALATRFFALLGAWGRAHAASRSALDEIDTLDSEAVGLLAELSFRAGYEHEAVGLWSRVIAPDQVVTREETLRIDMGWVDAPYPPGRETPAILFGK